jgi:hypothetical protein
MPEISDPPVELASVFQDPKFDQFAEVLPIAVPHFDYSEPGLGVSGVSSAVVDSPVSAPEPAVQPRTEPTVAPTPAPAESASPEGV